MGADVSFVVTYLLLSSLMEPKDSPSFFRKGSGKLGVIGLSEGAGGVSTAPSSAEIWDITPVVLSETEVIDPVVGDSRGVIDPSVVVVVCRGPKADVSSSECSANSGSFIAPAFICSFFLLAKWFCTKEIKTTVLMELFSA